MGDRAKGVLGSTPRNAVFVFACIYKAPVRMIDQELLAAIVGFVGVALVVLLSLPALKHCLSNLIPRPSTPAATATAAAAVVEDSYQDEDGIATEKSLRAYTDLRPRVFLWLSLAAGLAASIASRVLLAKNGYPALEPRQRAVVVPTIWLEVSLWVSLDFHHFTFYKSPLWRCLKPDNM